MPQRWTEVTLNWEGPDTGELDRAFPWLSLARLLVLEFHIPMCAFLAALKYTTKFHHALPVRHTSMSTLQLSPSIGDIRIYP